MATRKRPGWAQEETFIAHDAADSDNPSLCWDPGDVMEQGDCIRDDGTVEVAVYRFSHVEIMRKTEPKIVRKKV